MALLDLFGQARRRHTGAKSGALLPSPSEEDYLDIDGASRLKQKIEAYWRARGHNVQIFFQHGPFVPALRSARVDIRSTMVNGFPPDWRRDASDA